MFTTVSARQIQREYKKVLEKANKSGKPIVVMSSNKPVGAVIGLDLLEKLQIEAMINTALKEHEEGKTVIIDTPEKLEQDLKELEQYVNAKD